MGDCVTWFPPPPRGPNGETMKHYVRSRLVSEEEFDLQAWRDRLIYGNVFIVENSTKKGKKIISQRLLNPSKVFHATESCHATNESLQLYGSSVLHKIYRDLMVNALLNDIYLKGIERIDWGDIKIQPAPRHYARALDQMFYRFFHRLASFFGIDPPTSWRDEPW